MLRGAALLALIVLIGTILPPVSRAGAAGEGRANAADVVRKERVETLLETWDLTESWPIRGLVLLSLGREWHPLGAKLVAKGLEAKDIRVRAFAVEALYRTDAAHLLHVASREIMDLLARRELSSDNETYRKRIQAILGRCVPPLEGLPPKECRKGWELIRKWWKLTPWKEPPRPEGSGRTVALPFLRRVLDLAGNDFEMVVVIDSTGSMGRVINAARDSIEDLASVLGQICARLKLGLVTYRDLPDMPGGATRLLILTRNHKRMYDRLAALQAGGGGDAPEAVEKGLELALSREMGWTRDANKLVVLVGDAPPHPGVSTERAIAIAREGFRNPRVIFAGGRTVTPGKKKTRPIIVSAIGAGTRVQTFPEIAAAGGGSYATMQLGKKQTASRAVLRHILLLAFGTRWQKQVGTFLEVFYVHRDGGLFK